MLAGLGDYVGKTAGKFLHVVDVEELVGSVSVGIRPKNSSDEELAAWPKILQQSHERNRSSFSHTQQFVAVEQLRSFIHCFLEVGLVLV